MKRTFLFALSTLVLGLLLGACGPQNAPAATPLPAPTDAANAARLASCTTENHAPMDAFRSDPASKLTASSKPKLLEFYAVW